MKALFFAALALSFSAYAQQPSRFEKKPAQPRTSEQVDTLAKPDEVRLPVDSPESAQSEHKDKNSTPPVRTEPAPAKPQEANRPSKGFDPARMTYGGWASLQFGSYTVVGLSPRVGYWFTERLNAGVGLTYLYLNDQRVRPTYEQSVYGLSPYASYNVFGPVAISLEYEILNTDVLTVNPVTYEYSVSRDWVPAFYVGLSYLPPEGGVFFQLLYNVLDGPQSLFANPVIRFGASF
jgi:hypothetical protein